MNSCHSPNKPSYAGNRSADDPIGLGAQLTALAIVHSFNKNRQKYLETPILSLRVPSPNRHSNRISLVDACVFALDRVSKFGDFLKILKCSRNNLADFTIRLDSFPHYKSSEGWWEFAFGLCSRGLGHICPRGDCSEYPGNELGIFRPDE